MKTLYVINSPSWTELSPIGLNNSKMFENYLSEDHVYKYYNFLKFGLVKKVIIFVEDHRWRVDGNFIKKKFETKYGNMYLVRGLKKFSYINSDPEFNYVYCWSKWWDCEKLKNKFVIVNPMFNGISHKNYIKEKYHHFALLEGYQFAKYLPKKIPYSIYRPICYDHENHTLNNFQSKIYDWIMISSFDPRKRHIEFLKTLKNSNSYNFKGCIIGRDPNNKKNKEFSLLRLTPTKVLKKIQKIQKEINFDLFLNVDQKTKIDLTLKSKVFVCTSKLDNGPRSQIEASQLKIPVLSMPHIGASEIISKGNLNGKLFTNFSDIPNILNSMINNITEYTCNENRKILDPKSFMPDIVKRIKYFSENFLK